MRRRARPLNLGVHGIGAGSVDAVEELGGVIVSYREDGEPVSVEFLNASARQLVQPGEVSVTLQTESVRG